MPLVHSVVVVVVFPSPIFVDFISPPSSSPIPSSLPSRLYFYLTFSYMYAMSLGHSTNYTHSPLYRLLHFTKPPILFCGFCLILVGGFVVPHEFNSVFLYEHA